MSVLVVLSTLFCVPSIYTSTDMEIIHNNSDIIMNEQTSRQSNISSTPDPMTISLWTTMRDIINLETINKRPDSSSATRQDDMISTTLEPMTMSLWTKMRDNVDLESTISTKERRPNFTLNICPQNTSCYIIIRYILSMEDVFHILVIGVAVSIIVLSIALLWGWLWCFRPQRPQVTTL